MEQKKHEVAFKCPTCGAIVTKMIDRELTETEKLALVGKKCGICYLRAAIEGDLDGFYDDDGSELQGIRSILGM